MGLDALVDANPHGMASDSAAASGAPGGLSDHPGGHPGARGEAYCRHGQDKPCVRLYLP